MLTQLGLGGGLDGIQVSAMLPGAMAQAALWGGWIVGPLVLGAVRMNRSKVAQV